MAPLARMVRAAMLEFLETDYIKAAWAAGLPRRRIYYGDALRNAVIPVVTALGLVFEFLMAGNAVVESVFGWPGIGNYAVKALMLKTKSRYSPSFCLLRSCTFWSISPLISSTASRNRGSAWDDRGRARPWLTLHWTSRRREYARFFRRRLLNNKLSFFAVCVISDRGGGVACPVDHAL